MDASPTSLITRMFNDIEADDDPRADNARHVLTDILVIAILAVMSGADDYPGVVGYGRDERDWLKSFLRLPHGIPSVTQHWVLDMAFNEDQSRVRTNHGDQNLAALRRIALGLLHRDKTVKLGAKNKRLKAGRNREYFLQVLLSKAEAK